MRNRENCLRIFLKVHVFLIVLSVKKNVNRNHETESFIYFSVFSAWEIIMVFETHSLGYSNPEAHSRMCRWIQGRESSCVTTGNTSVSADYDGFRIRTKKSFFSKNIHFNDVGLKKLLI